MDNQDILQISGSIGMVKLINSDKNIFIFYDDHSNKKYCNSINSIFLYDLFEIIKKNNSDTIILLEEPFINNYSNIKFLWNDTPHIIKFRKFYKKIMKDCVDTKTCYTFPIDIRLCICDISIDELYENINNKEYFKKINIDTKQYFKYLLYLFDLENISNNFESDQNDILFVKKVFDTFSKSIYYLKLKEQFQIIFENFIKPNLNLQIYEFICKFKNRSFDFAPGYPFENSNLNNFSDQYDKLINGIMEFYMCILIFGMKYTNNIIYTGYYHANNITYILKKYYNFKEVYTIGNVKQIELIDDRQISNCLYIDKKIFNN